MSRDAIKDNLYLKEGQGGPGRGGDVNGMYWHIYLGEKRVGNIFINEIDEEPIGQHFSLQIYINKSHRNKGIGSIAYRMACEASELESIYIQVAKKNIASIKAAQNADFVMLNKVNTPQVIMRWERSKQNEQD